MGSRAGSDLTIYGDHLQQIVYSVNSDTVSNIISLENWKLISTRRALQCNDTPTERIFQHVTFLVWSSMAAWTVKNSLFPINYSPNCQVIHQIFIYVLFISVIMIFDAALVSKVLLLAIGYKLWCTQINGRKNYTIFKYVVLARFLPNFNECLQS